MSLGVSKTAGNVLGSARAEADSEMLNKAFVETSEYRALVDTTDFNFVVGRRGAGKSALFQKVSEHYKKASQILLILEKPQEHEMLQLQKLLMGFGSDYKTVRALSRLVWKTHIYLSVLAKLKDQYKYNKSASYGFLIEYTTKHKDILKLDGVVRCNNLLNGIRNYPDDSQGPIGRFAGEMQFDILQEAVKSALSTINKTAIVIFDGLDEGWTPDIVPTAALGGLAIASADLADNQSGIHCILFVRDNMFRSLAQLDSDFSRHIEGNTIRLHWDENSLLHFVGMRLRISLNMTEVENDIKVWNRFAHRTLQDRLGFQKCLQHTLFRPRDTVVLLNGAYNKAQGEGRDSIIDADVDATAKTISENRLDDLFKEYDAILPGLRLFISLFNDKSAQNKYTEIIEILNDAIRNLKFEDPREMDFPIFGSGEAIFSALYSVGFIGVLDHATGRYNFCHDGSSSGPDSIENAPMTMIHPCYWKALSLHTSSQPEDMMVQINDEYKSKFTQETSDLRVKQLGQILGKLPNIPIGTSGSTDFENWVFTAITILFSGKLSNPQKKPNENAIQRRDIVATNNAKDGFWRRILEDYKSRQVVFEVKNYEALKPEDFRQVLSYSSGEYGSFSIIVSRANNEVPSETDAGWLQTLYHEHKRVIMIVTASMLEECISKLRTQRKFDYAEDLLNKKMDYLIRSCLNLKHQHKFRHKKK